MKEIIRHGKIDRYIHTCSKCGCEFLYDENDLWTMGTLSCPECGKNDLPKNDLLHETIEEQETREHLSNKDVSEIAKMSAQISVMQNLLFAISKAIRDNKQPTEYIGNILVTPLENLDIQAFRDIANFIDEHTKTE